VQAFEIYREKYPSIFCEFFERKVRFAKLYLRFATPTATRNPLEEDCCWHRHETSSVCASPSEHGRKKRKIEQMLGGKRVTSSIQPTIENMDFPRARMR
jgi:hypothetical protein